MHLFVKIAIYHLTLHPSGKYIHPYCWKVLMWHMIHGNTIHHKCLSRKELWAGRCPQTETRYAVSRHSAPDYHRLCSYSKQTEYKKHVLKKGGHQRSCSIYTTLFQKNSFSTVKHGLEGRIMIVIFVIIRKKWACWPLRSIRRLVYELKLSITTTISIETIHHWHTSKQLIS